jgi:hypothetical protein
MTPFSSDFLTRISFSGDWLFACRPVSCHSDRSVGISGSCFASSPCALKVRDVSTSLDMTNDARNKPIRDRPFGFRNPWLQLGLSVACVLLSEFLLKRGATQVAEPDSAFSWTGINGLASPLVWWAILLIIASFISWLYVVRYIPLTIAFPLLHSWTFWFRSAVGLFWANLYRLYDRRLLSKRSRIRRKLVRVRTYGSVN